jgi:hypothetical protein
MQRILMPSLLVLALAATAGSFENSILKNAKTNLTAMTATHRRAHRMKKFGCLPKDVRPDQIVAYGAKPDQNISVEKKLTQMKARCRNGKLVDSKIKEIRFFRMSCWGNPPPDYLEIERRENEELENLKRRYTVIVFMCNPMTP